MTPRTLFLERVVRDQARLAQALKQAKFETLTLGAPWTWTGPRACGSGHQPPRRWPSDRLAAVAARGPILRRRASSARTQLTGGARPNVAPAVYMLPRGGGGGGLVLPTAGGG